MILSPKVTEGTAKNSQQEPNSQSMETEEERTEINPTIKNEEQPAKGKKKKKLQNPEVQLKFALGNCSKLKDLAQAITHYEKAMSEGIKLNQYHYNTLLYLCSSQAMGLLRPEETTEEAAKDLALKKGFEIYEQMVGSNITPNEATFTAVARLAAAGEDGYMAFDMAKKMVSHNLSPRLRSYSPALLVFCKKKEADKAYEVDDYMVCRGVQPEEDELEALLRLSVEVGRVEKVYSLLHRLRVRVRQVSASTCDAIELWFKSKVGREVGDENWDADRISEAMVSTGGGWHGKGWLRKGDWKVEKTNMSSKGVCKCCGEQLVSIDIDPVETDNFAKSLVDLACAREAKSNFKNFEEWLDRHGPYDFVVDGANVGLYQQNFADGGFSVSQLNSVVNVLRQRSPNKKWPLILLHNKRATGAPADNTYNKQLIEDWRKAGALYTTPTGSNDDWYWLYAAVRFKCLLVTNDEMRDHLFELLGNEFFLKWKEKHQVRFTFNKSGPQFHMPPPYSIVIQESERGSWHIPIKGGDDIEMPRSWLCVTRSGACGLEQWSDPSFQERNTLGLSEDSGFEGINDDIVSNSNMAVEDTRIARHQQNTGEALCPVFSTQTTQLTSEADKRKRRSMSPSSPCRQPYSCKIRKESA